ncbi:MAG: helix-turn-helix transcriptional regulator [Myxococcota bacterium]
MQSFLVLMRETFGLMSIVVGNALSTSNWSRELGVPDGWHARFEELREHDPSQAALMNAPLGTWWVKSEHDDGDNIVFAEGRKFGIRDVAIAVLTGPFRSLLRLVLARSLSQEDFSHDDVALLRLLYPHFVGALGTQFALAALQQPPDATDPHAVQGLRGHAYLSFPQREVEWSDEARAFWDDRVGPLSARGWKPLSDALLAAAAEFYGAHLAGRSQNLIAGVRVEFAFVPPKPGEIRRVLALFIDEAEADENMAGPGRLPTPEAAVLSARQLEVARLAASGRSLAEIARDVQISVHTARAHLREAYRRLGVSSRAELASKLPT